MPAKAVIVGVGMTKFMKPSENNPDYPEMAKIAVNRALMDANIDYKETQAAIVGYVYGDSTCGQRYYLLLLLGQCMKSE
jgi:sterol carrier protein 2